MSFLCGCSASYIDNRSMTLFREGRSLKYQRRILCLCPVLHSTGDFSADAVKYPMFWLNYEDLRPYLRDHLVVNQGMNTAARFTMEEFFSLGQYEGDIYKEQNLRGLSLKQQVGDNPDSLKMAQQKLDNDLRAFEDSIWIKDPVKLSAAMSGVGNNDNYAEQISQLNRNIQGLNTMYEIQLKSVSSQLSTIEEVNRGLNNIRSLYENGANDSYKIRQESDQLARNLQQLNEVYARMLQAMTTNMK